MLSASVSLYGNGMNIINWNIDLRYVHGMYEVDTYCRSCVPSNVYVCVCFCVCECVKCRANILFLLSVHVLFFDPKISARLEFLNFQYSVFILLFVIAYSF